MGSNHYWTKTPGHPQGGTACGAKDGMVYLDPAQVSCPGCLRMLQAEWETLLNYAQAGLENIKRQLRGVGE